MYLKFLSGGDGDFNITNVISDEAGKFNVVLSGILERVKGMIPSIIFALIVLIAGILFSRLLVSIIIRGMKHTHVDKTARGFLKSLLKIVLYTLVSVITLSLLNVPMTSIITVIGAAGLAIGLALQNSISNVAGGFVILFSQPFKSGDYIETNDVSGTVENITILYTKLTTPDNKTIFIPNGKITDSKLINYTRKETRRLDMEFIISYENDFEKAGDILNKILSDHEMALKEPAWLIRIGSYNENSVVIHLKVWVSTADYWTLYYDILENARNEFIKNDIAVPCRSINVQIQK